MTVPQEAIDAALKKAATESWTRISSRSVRELLEAALPAIITAATEQNTEPDDGNLDFLRLAHAAGAAAERDRIAARLAAYARNYPEDIFPPDSDSRDAIGGTAMRHAYRNAAVLARENPEES